MQDSKTASSKVKSMKIQHRYIIAIAVLIVFAFILFSVDAAISFIIRNYFSGLDQYLPYAWDASNALVGILGSYVIYRLFLSIININAAKAHEKGAGEIQKIILRVIFYAVVIFVILTAFGVNPSGALAGGAVGGVIIGLAAQTTLTSILSGFLLSSSKTIIPGDIVILRSSYWGSVDMLVKIIKVNTLYTEALTANGNKMRFPNPLLLNYVVLTHLDNNDQFVYPMQVQLNWDVNASTLVDDAKPRINKAFSKLHVPKPEIIFSSKGNFVTVFTVLIKMTEFSDVNKLMEIVNREFERAYWELKK